MTCSLLDDFRFSTASQRSGKERGACVMLQEPTIDINILKIFFINIGTIKSNKIKLSKTKITKFKSNNVKN